LMTRNKSLDQKREAPGVAVRFNKWFATDARPEYRYKLLRVYHLVGV
jgi:hypothetical protein